MSRHLMIAVFARDAELLVAARAAREAGLRIVDAHTPYAVHGLADAMGLPPSRLSWVCFAAGATGAILKLWFELWTAVVDWPLNVGGKPHNSLPAFVPITFEVMVLFAGLATVAAFFIVARLWPGREAHVPIAGVTDDRFALIVERTSAAHDTRRLRNFFASLGAIQIEDRVTEVAA